MSRLSALARRDRTRRGAGGELSAAQLTLAWQSASLLLGYPGPELPELLGLVGRVLPRLPERVATPLRATVERLSATPPQVLEADYVATFDSRRRNSLFLTYFAYGDTRKRGMALLRLKQRYAAAGFTLTDSGPAGAELPDHLCVVLEFAATIDQDAGRQLLLDHRGGLEVLRMSLTGEDSCWSGAVAAVCATLPPLDGDDVAAVRRLAAEGPPEERIGLDPYRAAGPDPGGPPEPVALPMPVPRGRG